MKWKNEEIGDEVRVDMGSDSKTRQLVPYAAYMLLWNPDRYEWSEQDRFELLAMIESGMMPEGDWSMRANGTAEGLVDSKTA
ncbi:hypothetical protein GCM10009700_08080 [Brevibacterium sanguinis]|uniref:hypothetical protein n=1 Tax=Brevibacterium sanguinis TaxID=232444 RepID=UPI0031D92168